MALTVHHVKTVPEGDDVEVKRLFPIQNFMNFDPFVLCDHFEIGAGRGFPDHPHRGFEAITYMLEGGMNHKDNLGNDSFVEAGGLQRFTAGRGLVHSEMPAETGISRGIQLWINLPQRLKKIAPDYQQMDEKHIPVQEIPGGKVKNLVGDESALKLNTEIIYQHLYLNGDAKYQLNIKPSMRGFIYMLKGTLTINQQNLQTDQALFIEDISQLEFVAKDESECLICFGVPHNEAIHQHGPFVD